MSRKPLILSGLLAILTLGVGVIAWRSGWPAARPVEAAPTTASKPPPQPADSSPNPVVGAAVHHEEATDPSSSPPAPLVFGLNGLCRLEDVPAGRFRSQLLALAPEARARALAKLGRLQVPLHDLASLHVDANGYLFYACAAATERDAATGEPLSAGPALPVPGTGLAAVPIANPPVRHSKPGSTNVIYLDFNGHTIRGTSWNQAGDSRPAVATYVAKAFSTDADYTNFSDEEQAAIIRIWERVAEDYKPYDVDVTTEEPAVFTNTTGRILITDSVDANGVTLPGGASAGGIAYLDVFGEPGYVSTYSPAFVYVDKNSRREDNIADTASHEIGHNFSLSHDGTASSEYYGGHGSGETSWGPIMGSPYNKNLTQWSKGEYANANNQEDDLAIIAGHLGYAADDHSDSNTTATGLSVSGQDFSGTGVIGRTGEADRFSFMTAGGIFTVNAVPYRSPFYAAGGNLDVAIELYDGANNLIASNSPAGATGATVGVTLGAGTFYLRIHGAGNGAVLGTGYSNYGSLGQYALSVTNVPPVGPTFTGQPSNRTVIAGQTTQFSVAAAGTPSPAFRWQRLPAGSAVWSDLTDSGGFTGSGTPTLSVVAALAMNTDQFRCEASNLGGNATSTAATLTVTAAIPRR
jgi:hypothetical protein